MTKDDITPAATLVLGVLRERPNHPYEVLATLRKRRDDRLVRLSPGTVYHAIGKLEAAGLVEPVGVEREGNRPERTTYRATAAGAEVHEARVADLVTDVSREYPRFPVALALIHDLPLGRAVALLSERRDAVAGEAAEQRSLIEDVIERGLPRRHVLDVLHDVATAEAHVAWLDETLADLRSGALSWTEVPAPGFRRPHDLPATPDPTPQETA